MYQPALHAAVEAGRIEEIKRLLAGGANLHEHDSMGFTPLHCAVHDARLDICGLLLSSGVDVDCEDESGSTALRYACSAANETFKKTAGDGSSLLGICAFLLENGADSNSLGPKGLGSTPLHVVINTLVKIRAPWRTASLESIGPAEMVAVARMLCESGASPGLVPPKAARAYLTPFQYAVSVDEVELARYFVLDCGESLSQRTLDGRSLVSLASGREVMTTTLRALKTELSIAAGVDAPEVDFTSTGRQSSVLSPL